MASINDRILLFLMVAAVGLCSLGSLCAQFQSGDLVVEEEPECPSLACNNYLLVYSQDGSLKSQTPLSPSQLHAGFSGGNLVDNHGTLYWTNAWEIYRMGSDSSLHGLSAPSVPFGYYYSLVTNAGGNLYAASDNGTVARFGADDALLGVTSVKSDLPPLRAIDLTDQCTLIYGNANSIGRFNVCTAQPLPPLVGSLPKAPLAFRVRRDGSILMATTSASFINPVYLLDPSGAIQRTYGSAGAIALDRDGHSFWSGDGNRIQKVDIDTGAVSTTITLPFYVVSMAVIGEPRAAADATQIPAFSTIALAFLGLILAVTGLMRVG